MVLRIITLAVCCWCFTAQAAITRINRELFAPASNTNVISLQSTNVGAFGFIKGTMPIVGVGARATNDTSVGWSAFSTNIQGYGAWPLTKTGMVCGWWEFSSFGDGVHDSSMIGIWGTTFALYSLDIRPAGNLSVSTATNAMTPLSLYTWYPITFAWLQHADKSLDMNAYVGTNLTLVYSVTNRSGSAFIVTNTVGSSASGTVNNYSGRLSGVSLYQIDSFADVVWPSDIQAPPTNRNTWFFNSQTGSDLNDGLDITRPFQSSARMAAYMNYGAFLPNATNTWVYTSDSSEVPTNLAPDSFVSGITNGTIRANADIVKFDTSGGPFVLANYLQLSAQNSGLEITSATAQQAYLRSTLTMTGATQYDAVNFTNIWVFTNCEPSTVLWEDLRWMNNPTNSTIVGVRTNLNTTPGSFWNGSSNIYFTPFEVGLNPNTATNVFERSRKLDDYKALSQEIPSCILDGNDFWVHNISLGNNCFRNQTNGAMDALYVIQPRCGGRTAIGDCRFFNGSNHNYGATDGVSNLFRLCYRTVIDQGPPDTWVPNSSGYNPCVEFTPQSSFGPRTAYFVDVNWSTNGLVGSASGVTTMDVLTTGFFCHTTGTNPIPYALLQFDRCIGGIGNGISTNTFITNCSLGFASFQGPTVAVNSTFYSLCFGFGPFTVQNSIFKPLATVQFSSENQLSRGPFNFLNNTFDMSLMPTNTFSYLKTANSTNSTYVLSNNVIICYAPVIRTKATDTVTSDNNVVVLAQPYFFQTSTNATWPVWLSTWSTDTHSQTNTYTALDSRYRPYSKTPLWNIGAELGPATDFTGKLYQSRRTAGAYEYTVPNPQFLFGHR